MTITEASQLVIQAGAMGKHSEVFVLDMGKSVKIKDLINKMINLLGFKVKDSKNPKGDIRIKIIGLRPGEKLFEELLIGSNPQETNHSKIKKINDPYINFKELEIYLKRLKNLIEKNKASDVKKLLIKLLKTFNSSSKIVDNLYCAQKKGN